MNCHQNCRYFEMGYEEYGNYSPDVCNKVWEAFENTDQGEDWMAVYKLIESLYFQLSFLNNCPGYAQKVRKINDNR